MTRRNPTNIPRIKLHIKFIFWGFLDNQYVCIRGPLFFKSWCVSSLTVGSFAGALCISTLEYRSAERIIICTLHLEKGEVLVGSDPNLFPHPLLLNQPESYDVSILWCRTSKCATSLHAFKLTLPNPKHASPNVLLAGGSFPPPSCHSSVGHTPTPSTPARSLRPTTRPYRQCHRTDAD